MSNLRKRFIIREIEEVKRDLEIAKKKYEHLVKRIFFLDGNAMVTPTEQLLEATKYAFKLFSKLERCSVYAHSKDIIKKTDDQLAQLSEAGLTMAYVGFESGYDDLLKLVHKHALKEDHVKASKKLMKANITLSATLINGLGGADDPELSKMHAIESADLVNKICPDDERTWYIAFLSLMVPPGTEIYKQKARGEFKEMTSRQILEELKVFIKNIEFHNKKAQCVFRSNHASNYLPIKGILDRDKEKILDVIDYGLTHKEALRPDYYRAL